MFSAQDTGSPTKSRVLGPHGCLGHGDRYSLDVDCPAEVAANPLCARAPAAAHNHWNLSAHSPLNPYTECVSHLERSNPMNGIVYLIGLVVVVIAIFSFIA